MFKKGNVPWNKGRSASPQARKNLIVFEKGHTPWNKGVQASPELLAKFSECHKGQIPWNKGTKGVVKGFWKGKKRPDISAKCKERGFTEEHLRHLKEATHKRKGTKNKQYRKSPSYKHNNTVFKKGLSPWNKGKEQPQELKDKVRATLKAKGIQPSNEARAKALHIKDKPTRPEAALGKLLQKACPDQYKYTGDGTFMIGRRFPDFVNINGKKKVVEMYGDYWHKNQVPQKKIDEYALYGFDCLIIWESDLKKETKESLVDRIRCFNND